MPLRKNFLFLETLTFVIFVALFSFFTHCTHFLSDGALYWDTAKIYPEFRDGLQALNHFGEIAWWLPHNQTGSPGYYHSILGIPSLSNPVFVLLGLSVWLLGKAKILLYNFHPLYVSYFGFWIPLLFLFSVRALAQRLWRTPFFTGLALILSAFSPGITFHMSDIGYLEPTAYGLFFCSAYIDYCHKPGERNFWKLVFCTSLVSLSATHGSFYWNAYFLPLFILATSFTLKTFPLPRLCVTTLFGLLIVALPLVLNGVVFYQGRELVRSSIGMSQTYPFDRLAPGNPLEALIVSLPGFGFDWNSDRTYFKLMPLSNKYHSSFHYMGLLTFPLFVFALLRSSQKVRQTVLAFFLTFFGIIVLSGYSPVFATFLRLPTPFRSCNHFSDAAFKAGGFLIVLFGALHGLSTFLRTRQTNTIGLLTLLGLSSLFCLCTHLYFLGTQVSESLVFGLLIFWTFTYSILIFWLKTDSRKRRTGTLAFLIFAITVDVSTQSYLWIRNITQSKVILNSGWPAYAHIDETPAEDGIGLKIGEDRHFYTNLLLMYPAYFRWQLNHMDPKQLPYLVATAATNLHIEKKTFNTLRLGISLNRSDTLFIRDAFSPYWRAWIDGVEVPIVRMKENYKSLQVAPGVHSIFLRFRPEGVPELFLLSYFGITCAGAFLWAANRRERKRTNTELNNLTFKLPRL